MFPISLIFWSHIKSHLMHIFIKSIFYHNVNEICVVYWIQVLLITDDVNNRYWWERERERALIMPETTVPVYNLSFNYLSYRLVDDVRK